MPVQARFFIRTALVYGLLAFLLGGLLLINQGLTLYPRLGALLPVFYHLLMVGWAFQLICGVALWMFPPLSREQPRGNERLGWVVYGTLNVGLLLRAIWEPWLAWGGAGWPLVVSALLQIVAMWVFVWLIWPRVKGRAKPKVQ